MYFYIKSKFELIKKTSACKVIAYLENSHIHIAAFVSCKSLSFSCLRVWEVVALKQCALGEIRLHEKLK